MSAVAFFHQTQFATIHCRVQYRMKLYSLFFPYLNVAVKGRVSVERLSSSQNLWYPFHRAEKDFLTLFSGEKLEKM